MEGGGGRRAGRNVQAFKDLMDPEFLDEDLLGSKGKSRKANAARKKEGNGRLKGFRFREDVVPEASSEDASIIRLADMFGGRIDGELLRAVHANSGSSVEATAAALRQMGFGSSEPGPSVASSGAHAASSSNTQGKDDAPRGPCWWDVLPEDLKLSVWQHLNARELAKAALVGREFAARARQWRAKRTELVIPGGLSRPALKGMISAYPAASHLSFRRCLPDMRHAANWLQHFEAIQAGSRRRLERGDAPVTSLDLRGAASLTDVDIANLLATINTIQELNLAGCEALGANSLQELIRYSAWGLADAVAVPDPEQQNLPAQPEAEGQQPVLGHTARRHVQKAWAAKEARGSRPPKVDVGTARSLGLRRLNISGCRAINAAGLKALVTTGCTATSLEELAASHLPAVEDAFIAHITKANLRTLKAQHCPNLRRVVLTLSPRHPLKELHLAGCPLESFTMTAPAVAVLNLSQCRRLEQLSISTPALESLQLALCPRLQSVELLSQLPATSRINVNGCASLLSSTLQALLHKAPSLQHLDMNGCVRISSLDLSTQPELLRLDVTGCHLLNRVSCPSVGLRQLLAVGCVRLQEVSLLSKALEILDVQNCAELVAVLLGGVPSSSNRSAGSGHRFRYCIAGCVRLSAETRAALRDAGRPLDKR